MTIPEPTADDCSADPVVDYRFDRETAEYEGRQLGRTRCYIRLFVAAEKKVKELELAYARFADNVINTVDNDTAMKLAALIREGKK